MQESINICANYLTKFVVDFMEFSELFRYVGLMNLILIVSQLINVQGREWNLCDFSKGDKYTDSL